MANKKHTEDLMELTKIFKALSHPSRVYIIKELSGMNSCCYSGDMAKKLNISPSTLSQHLKELKYAGLIQGEIEAPFIKYCINKSNWEKIKKKVIPFFDIEVNNNNC